VCELAAKAGVNGGLMMGLADPPTWPERNSLALCYLLGTGLQSYSRYVREACKHAMLKFVHRKQTTDAN